MSGSSACDDALLNPASQSAYATRIRNCDAFDLGGYDSGAFWHAYGLMSTVELASAGLIRYPAQTRAIRWSILVLALHYIVWIIVVTQRSGVPVLASIPLSLPFPGSGVAWSRHVRRLRHPRSLIGACGTTYDQ